ncbi:cysteine desulfurase family protein [Aequorivita sublithincola DSM 14238]|uniref:cysteine desulfurase n=1 Tax=Aequorivita sublithincola (strain DSM 14238 / LMG 21431 / ACAM 643 / 9-3) TaxID=746697 RepID=I3YYJ1_AEQSU|nr:cysteine desulfurase family protein [Aequorivita sublithincola]AFL82059.1 cysteine desulfurase family protein [Aequorivita sublithincola DSM 14238]
MKKVYFDSAATTRLRDEVTDRITEVLKTEYGNPSSTHSYGRSSKSILENSRKEIAKHLNVSASEIIFTSGGTEADNLALTSAVRDLGVNRIISSRIEHHAVLHTLQWLQKEYNIKLDFVNLKECGQIDIGHLDHLLATSSEKTLVSLMHVNNEVGNVLDLKRVALLCKFHKALFHSDTVQSVGHFELDFKEIPIDFAAVSAHKFHGPKGTGFAFIRKNSGLRSLIHGGEQERGMRAGTESVYAIAGMAEALNVSYKNLEKERKYITDLKGYFKTQLAASFPEVKFNGSCGDDDNSTYTLLNICLPISSDKAMLLLFQLDLKGIACSKGSACQSGSVGGSHVLNEILSDEDLSKPSIRFSFSSFNTKEEVDYVVDVLKEFVGTGIG